MDVKKSRKIIVEAVNSGCRTMGELAHYLKLTGQTKLA